MTIIKQGTHEVYSFTCEEIKEYTCPYCKAVFEYTDSECENQIISNSNYERGYRTYLLMGIPILPIRGKKFKTVICPCCSNKIYFDEQEIY